MNESFSWFDIIFSGSFFLNFLIMIVVYLYFSYCLMKISERQGIKSAWLSFIPLANLYMLGKAAGKSTLFIVFLFVPLINFILGIIAWFAIAERMNRPAWTSILLFIPFINLAIPWYYATGTPSGISIKAENQTWAKSAERQNFKKRNTEDQTNFCPECGSEFSNSEKFCGECGYDLSKIVIEEPIQTEKNTASENHDENKRKNNSTLVPVLLSSLTTLILVVAGIVTYNYLTESDDVDSGSMSYNNNTMNNQTTQKQPDQYYNQNQVEDNTPKNDSNEVASNDPQNDYTGSTPINPSSSDPNNPNSISNENDAYSNYGDVYSEEEKESNQKIFSLGGDYEDDYYEEDSPVDFIMDLSEEELNEEIELDIGENNRIVITQRELFSSFGPQSDLNSLEFTKAQVLKSSPASTNSNMTGLVRVDVLITKQGKIEKIVYVSGLKQLLTDAHKTIRRYVFKPASLGGRAVKSWLNVDLQF